MGDGEEEIAEFLDRKPELADSLRELLEIDEKHDNWTFSDVSLDSGTFGELVSRGIADKRGDGFQLRDPAAVRAALGDDPAPRRVSRPALSRPPFSVRNAVDLRSIGALLGALVFLLLMRIHQFPALFREEHWLSPGNDPYFYRYWNDVLLAESTDWSSTTVVAGLPSGAATRRPFTHAANWWIASVLGGDQWAADVTAIWLPVIATLLLGVVLFFTARILTDDVRVGVATVFFLALVPIHAVYSGLGFLEHRLHQYFWLGVTLLALTWLAVDLQRRLERMDTTPAISGHLSSVRTWFAALVLAPALAFSIHAWGGSILMCIPLAAYIAGRAVLDARRNVPPALANIPLVAGIGIATLLSAFLHFRWGWHEAFTVYVPLLVLGGALGVLVLGEIVRYSDWPTPWFLIAQGIIGGLGIVIFRARYPDLWDRLLVRSEDLIAREGATETISLFDNLFTPFLQIGLDLVLAFAVLGWAWLIVTRRYEPAWLLVSTYATVWLVFAYFQGRFAAQASVILSIFGGLGLVYLLSWVDLARTPKPFRQSEDSAPQPDRSDTEPAIMIPQEPAALGYIALILLLFTGLSLIFVPSLAADTTYDEDQYDALLAIEGHYEETGALGHEEFVLSEWGENRMYNYFLHGEARSYGYARSNYVPVITGEDLDGSYASIEGQVGYLVISQVSASTPPEVVYSRLHGDIGPESATLPDAGHYRALYLGDRASAYAVVPGANITVSGADDQLETSTAVTVDGTSHTYTRTLTDTGEETVATTVAYPGEYDVAGQRLSVTEEDVVNGSTIEVQLDE